MRECFIRLPTIITLVLRRCGPNIAITGFNLFDEFILARIVRIGPQPQVLERLDEPAVGDPAVRTFRERDFLDQAQVYLAARGAYAPVIAPRR